MDTQCTKMWILILKTWNVVGEGKKSGTFDGLKLSFYQLNLDCYKYVLYDPHGNHKTENYSRYTEKKKKRKDSKHTTTENH